MSVVFSCAGCLTDRQGNYESCEHRERGAISTPFLLLFRVERETRIISGETVSPPHQHMLNMFVALMYEPVRCGLAGSGG